ncbi:MAG: hypothetical protein Q8867_06790, partial [Bacteroidota bacterium]|nr:hypothetical protein [Bacteroidota bacterium]
MKRKILILIFSILSPLLSFSQGEFNKWYFGNKAALDFNSGIPVALTNSCMVAIQASATVSDSLGNLLFYSPGTEIYNRNNAILQNGFLLYCNPGNSQPVCSVKILGSDSLYYLFTLRADFPNIFGLFYSIIDMSLDGGLGGVISGQKNIPVNGAGDALDKLYAIRHKNNRDIWLVTNNWNVYYSFLITSSGISSTPVVSPSAVHFSGPFLSYGNGVLKISQDGTKFAACFMNDSTVEFGTFDDLTGELHSLFKFRPNCPPYMAIMKHCEFSPDSKKIYVEGRVPFSTTDYHQTIFQYDATKTDSAQFMQSQYIVYNSPNLDLGSQGLQLGPDFKIYANRIYRDSLSVIDNPNVQGPGCNFIVNAVSLAGKIAYYDFPQLLQKYKAYLHYTGTGCNTDSLHFSGDIWPPADTIRWNFGDPASGVDNVSFLPDPVHIYSSPGTYTVEL